jgi:1-deoxy-D-xylulose-5-phosphate reductoisomerase
MLVLDLADDFLDDILDADQPLGAAELVDHDRKVHPFGAHPGEQVEDAHRFGDEQRRTKQASKIRRRLRGDRMVAEAGLPTEVSGGAAALERVAALPEVDMVMAAIVGAAGLPATLAAARAGKDVLLANKEALVMSGTLFMAAMAEGGGRLLPVDSEHSAIFQSLPRGFACGREGELERAGVRRILLTASGGPFRTTPIERLARVTPQQACAHPNWVMGRKISVDSATMMNKGLEVIEARWLFAAPPEALQVVIHPQSVIHSMVEYRDGSVIAQLGAPDMRTPIACALSWPDRIEAGVEPLDFTALGALDVGRLDLHRFPCVRLAPEALRRRGPAPALLNAANEIAVESFLDERLAFTQIPEVIEHVLGEAAIEPLDSLERVYAADIEARAAARRWVARRPRMLA